MAKDTGDQKAAEDQKNDSKSETEQNKAAAAKRQAENESKKNEGKQESKSVVEQSENQQAQSDGKDSSFLNTDTFDNPDARGLTAYQTATDGQGVERIIGPATTAWSPAPLEATDEQKQQAEARNASFEEASKARQAQFGEGIKDEDRAENNPADGGSQQTPAL